MIEAVARPELPRVRWTARSTWHITLRFLGEVDRAEAGDALAGVTHPSVVASLGPAIEPLGMGVAVVPVSGLAGLVAAIDGAMSGTGDPPSYPEFFGHLTVARAPGRARIGPVPASPISCSFEVKEIELLSSELRASGPRYETLTRHSLR